MSPLHLSSGFTTPSLSKLKSEENVHQSSGGDGTRPINVVRRSLSSEKFPRSGSWNSHKHISSPVLPNKYIAPDRMRYVVHWVRWAQIFLVGGGGGGGGTVLDLRLRRSGAGLGLKLVLGGRAWTKV